MPFRWPWWGPEIPDTDWPVTAGKPPAPLQWKRWAAKSPLRTLANDGSLVWCVGRSASNRYNRYRPEKKEPAADGPSLLAIHARMVKWKRPPFACWINETIVVPDGVVVSSITPVD